MAYVIDRQTKEISTMDTVEALARQDEFLVYHKTEVPKDVVSAAPQYRVIDGDKVRVATEAERVEVDGKVAAQEAARRTAARNAALDRAASLAAEAGTTDDPILLLQLGIVEEIVDELRSGKAGKPKASRELKQLIADVAKRLMAKKG